MTRRSRFITAAAAVAIGAFLVSGAVDARAQTRSKQIETEAKFVSFDSEQNSISALVVKPGRKVKGMSKLRKGDEAVFQVKPEGSVLTRTTVKLESGTAGSFEDLEPGRRLRIFWIPGEGEIESRFARSISVFVPAEEQGELVN